MSTLDTRERIGWMDRMFEEWMKSFQPTRALGLHWPFHPDDVIRVDEFKDGQAQVVRAELPGIDPAKDVEITVADGLLHINAERKVEEQTQENGFTRHELRSGSLTRTLPLPGGATEADITATYKDGILEIRVPLVEHVPVRQPTTIAVTKG